jgi:hypothetical protein
MPRITHPFAFGRFKWSEQAILTVGCARLKPYEKVTIFILDFPNCLIIISSSIFPQLAVMTFHLDSPTATDPLHRRRETDR